MLTGFREGGPDTFDTSTAIEMAGPPQFQVFKQRMQETTPRYMQLGNLKKLQDGGIITQDEWWPTASPSAPPGERRDLEATVHRGQRS